MAVFINLNMLESFFRGPHKENPILENPPGARIWKNSHKIDEHPCVEAPYLSLGEVL